MCPLRQKTVRQGWRRQSWSKQSWDVLWLSPCSLQIPNVFGHSRPARARSLILTVCFALLDTRNEVLPQEHTTDGV